MKLWTNLRERLKRNRLFRALNAALKNRQLERRAKTQAAEYASRLAAWTPLAVSDVRSMLEARMAAAGTSSLRHLSRPPVIFLVGTYYEQESAGFIQALERCGPVVRLVTREHRYGLRPPAGIRDRAIIEENSRQIVEQVAAAHSRHHVDVLVGTMVAQSLGMEALQHVRRTGMPVLNIAMDDRLPEHWESDGDRRLGAIGLAPATDLVLHTMREYIPRYLVEGHPAVFWPFGSDPELFRPLGRKRYDVSFVGNNYGWRSVLISHLQSAGVHVECFGSGFSNGHIDAPAVARAFGESRIVLGVGTVAHSRRVVTLKLRDFDAPMSGSLYLTTENPDLRDLFEVGREIEMYRSPAHCLQLIRHYLSHPAEREAVAAAGRRRAMRDHTWTRRIHDALGLLGWEPVGPRSEPSEGALV